MNIELNFATGSFVIAFLVHEGAIVWWASKITNSLKNITDSVLNINKELEKRDAQIAAQWKKIDGLSDRLYKVEAEINHKEV